MRTNCQSCQHFQFGDNLTRKQASEHALKARIHGLESIEPSWPPNPAPLILRVGVSMRHFVVSRITMRAENIPQNVNVRAKIGKTRKMRDVF